MKIVMFLLCVVLPSLCVCSPLPDDSAAASSKSGSLVQTNITGNILAKSISSSSATVTKSPAPPSTPPSPPPDPCPPAETDKPTEKGFTSYTVLKISNDEFKCKIDKITWFVAKYTPAEEEIESEVTVCADRHICKSCKAVKFQYVTEEGNFVMKEWGYDGTNLIYIQEDISFSSEDFAILKAEVVNVMKATKDSDKATPVDDDKPVKSALSDEYAILATDFKNYIVGVTSCDKGSIVFIAFIQEVYECEEKQEEFAEEISKALKDSGIDECKLAKLTQKFDVDTDKYDVKAETDDSDGKSTTVTHDTQMDGDDGSIKTSTKTTVSSGGPSPSDGSVDAKASSSSKASVRSVDDEKDDDESPPSDSPASPPPPPPSEVDANASSDASVSVKSPPPPPDSPPPPPSPPSEVEANASSDASVSVKSPPPPPGSPPPPPSPPSEVEANASSEASASVKSPPPPPSNPPSPPPEVDANASSDASVSVKSPPPPPSPPSPPPPPSPLEVEANASSDASVSVNSPPPPPLPPSSPCTPPPPPPPPCSSSPPPPPPAGVSTKASSKSDASANF